MKINDIYPGLEKSKGKLITFNSGKRVELYFSEIYPVVQKAATWLGANGFNNASTIGIMAGNDLDRVITDLACICCGIKQLPLESGADIGPYITGGLQLSAVFISEQFAGQTTTIESYEVKCIRLNAFIQSEGITNTGADFIPYKYYDKEVFSFKSTSGSSGIPKLIGQVVQSVENTITGVQQLFQHSPNDSILVFLPLNLLQQRYWLYSAIIYQFTIIIVPRHLVFIIIRQEKPTVIMGIPYIFEYLREEFLKSLTTDSTLQSQYELFLTKNAGDLTCFMPFKEYLGGRINYLWTGSAPISNTVLEFYFQLGIPLYQGYGMNETCIIAKNYPGHNKTGSVGQLFPNVEIRFDTNSQILVKNKYPVCTHYTLCSKEDEYTFMADGYVATGDVGYMDEEGYLYITGRLKEMIALSNSKKIFPARIENKLRLNELVQHCIVYGDEKPFLTALIVPAKKEIDRSAIRTVIESYNSNSSEEEHIYRFFLVYDELNELLTSQDKIKRNKVYEKYAREFNGLYEQ